MDVSIVIVNYNTRDLLRNCLNSIYEKTKSLDFEVIVSDNGSVDGSVEMIRSEFPQVMVIENNANLGFGTANNRGTRRACGKYIFFLNSDTILLNNAVKLFFDYWESSSDRENIGAMGANLLDKNGNISHSGESFPSLNTAIKDTFLRVISCAVRTFLYFVFRKPIARISDQNESRLPQYGEIDQIVGADLFMLNNEDALFDDNIFLYCEETELEYRLYKKNKKRLLIDGPQIVHLEGASTKKQLDKVRYFKSFSVINFNLHRVYFFKKHFKSPFRVFVLKLCLFMLWMNPLIFGETKKYFGKLFKI